MGQRETSRYFIAKQRWRREAYIRFDFSIVLYELLGYGDEPELHSIVYLHGNNGAIRFYFPHQRSYGIECQPERDCSILFFLYFDAGEQ